MNNFVTKCIHKLLIFKKKFVLNKRDKNKHALISYVLFPPSPINFDFFFNISHNRYLKSYLMAESLIENGYTVHIYDYNDLDIDYSYNYELFIGHNYTFHDISLKLRNSCKKILLTTGSSPQFDNLSLVARQNDLNHRLGINEVFFIPNSNIEYVKKNIDIADEFFMIGNKSVSDTWGIENCKRIIHFNNVNNIKFIKKKSRTNNFIYLSSVGQLRRGLDLVIDTFKGRSEIIYICGNYNEEVFLKYYSNIISSSPNIRLMGYVDQTSSKFKEMVLNSDFAILPSCSEGQSGSILTLMSFGLLPVITDNVGFSNYKDYGFRISDLSLETVKEVVDYCIHQSDAMIDIKRDCLLNQANYYTKNAFKSNFSKILN